MGSYFLSHDAQDIDDTIDEVQAARGDSADLSARLAAIESALEDAIALADVFGNGTLIPDNSDLDDYTDIGKYYGGNSAGNSVDNLPIANGSFDFTLEVKQVTPSATIQSLKVCNQENDPYIFIRRRTSSEWQSWYRFTGEAVASN